MRCHRRRRGVTHTDLLVLLVLVPLLLAGLTACLGPLNRARESANRVKCASNLRQIGMALLLYANDNDGRLPRTIYKGGQKVTPVFGTGAAAGNPFAPDGPAANDVTAAWFLLLRTQQVSSAVFVCPSAMQVQDSFGGGGNTALNRGNFTNLKQHLSYSLQNPYPSDAAANAKDPARSFMWQERAIAPGFAMAADINPGTAGKGDNVLGVTAASPAKTMRQANSPNHGKQGQNVLLNDGSVMFNASPFAGISQDNIYTTAAGTVIDSPADGRDSILLPTDD